MNRYNLELWQSSSYGYTLIISREGSRSGFRLAGPKLWAGQNPEPKLVKTFKLTINDLLRAINS